MRNGHAKTWKKSESDKYGKNRNKAKIINEIYNTDITNIHYRVIVTINDIRIWWHNNIGTWQKDKHDKRVYNVNPKTNLAIFPPYCGKPIK